MTLGLPDLPRWVEAHGIAADPTSWIRDGAVGNPRAKLIVITDDARARADELQREFPDHTILAVEAPALPHAKALLHTLPDPDSLPDDEGAALLGDASLDHVPPALADELRAATRVWAAWVDGLPVCFAYAPWRSETLFDVSVDTLPSARQLGLATIVAAAMISDERAAGREPVWGADEDNVASRRLAHRLGFVEVDAIYVIPPRATNPEAA
jgi:GNAT acetyltransferase-like protein